MFDKINEQDQKFSSRFNLPPEKKFLRRAAAFFAHSGDSWFWLAALFIVWLFSHGRTHTIAALLAGAIVLQASLVLLIKFTIKRSRPESDWGDIYRKTDPNSFPSGHAVRAIMLAGLAWGLGLSPLNWILTIWAPLVGIARISLGVHYLSDVLAGWLLGIILALAYLSALPILYAWFPFILFN
jgi:undecaprenyl-diphosphatase